jgi:hypothetical protein
MEKPKTQAEARHDEFMRHAERAKQIGDMALRDIDHVLAGQDELLEQLRQSGLPDEEIGERLTAFRDAYITHRQSKEQPE